MLLRNESDLKAFYDAHYKLAVRQSFRIVNDLAEAEDVVQECVVKLWGKRNELSFDGDIVFYLKRMVRNRSIDQLRRKMPLDDSADLLDVGQIQTDHLEYSDLKHSIDQLIDSLPEKCRRIFVLSRFEQMSYKEISEQLSISPKTVENQISRALKALRAGLGDQFFTLFL